MSGDCDQCGEHAVDCECDKRKKVYILCMWHENFHDVLEVYATPDLAQQRIDEIQFPGSVRMEFQIIERDLVES